MILFKIILIIYILNIPPNEGQYRIEKNLFANGNKTEHDNFTNDYDDYITEVQTIPSIPTKTTTTSTTTTTTTITTTTTTEVPTAGRTRFDRIEFVYKLIDETGRNPFFDHPTEYQTYDGWYNNLGRPESGAVDTILLRKWPAAYHDGVSEPAGLKRQNPLTLSENFFAYGPLSDLYSFTGKNVLMVFFGQHVVGEIVDTQRPACPPEYMDIDIPEKHPYRKKCKKMPARRTRYDKKTGQGPNNPRQQLNGVTPYLDGGAIYGTRKVWADFLRTYANGTFDNKGKLAHSKDGKYPDLNKIRLPMDNPPPPTRHAEYTKRHYTEEVDRFYMLGNPRGNQNPFVLAISIIWFRWHNAIAEQLTQRYPLWKGERIFNEARKWVIATQQQIIFYEWLPQFLGRSLEEYKEYDPTTDPQIEQFFQTAAFRYGHTLVPSDVILRNYGKDGCQLTLNQYTVRTCNNYWMPENRIFVDLKKLNEEIDVERLIMGMTVQLADGEDAAIVDDLRKNLFGPLEFSRRDLVALNLLRGRDHGIPDYNTVRKIYDLHKMNKSNFMEIFPALSTARERLYKEMLNGEFDDMDLFMGGMMESYDGPGELFSKIIYEQFQRIRNGDRFWFENKKNGLFSEESIKKLKQLSFYDILMAVTDIGPLDLPKNAFKVPVSARELHPMCRKYIRNGNCYRKKSGQAIPCFHIPIPLNSEDCAEGRTYDYFSNSEISFLATFIGFIIFFIFFIIVIFCKLLIIQGKFSKLRPEIPKSSSDIIKSRNVFTVIEWVDYLSPSRPAIIILDDEKRQIQMKNQLGHLSRALDLNMTKKVMIFAPHNSPHLLLRVDHNYDLVLKFDSIYLRTLFSRALETYLLDNNVEREIISRITTQAVLKQAVTQKARQKKLEQFFRVVFSQAFNIAHSEDEILKIDSAVAVEVIYTELTLLEFAEALSMRPDSEFVKKIFNLVDTDKNGFISFREFIDMLVLFLKGTAEEKIKLMFDMYDINGTGQLKRTDFANMLRSFMETVNADISDDELESVVHSMMDQAHIAQKETIDLQDFKNILGEFNDKLSYAELEFNVNSDKSHKKLTAGKSTIRSTFIGEVKKTVESLYADPKDLKSRVEGKIEFKSASHDDARNVIDKNENIIQSNKDRSYMNPIRKYIANNQLQIFWTFLYTMVLLGIVIERYLNHYYLREHTGFRRIMGLGVVITRSAAAGIMFTYSSLLLTMCQNFITVLRDTVLQFYIPFDSAIEMHKYMAMWAMIFTVIHVVGSGFNLYHISTQPADDLTCLFKNTYHASHELPKFHTWMFTTVTGLTSIVLTILIGIIFICAIPIVRQKMYSWFEFSHSLYPLVYILLLLHGSGRLIQDPQFHYYFLGPATLFAIDKIFTVTRKRMQIPVLKAELLPSNVTSLIFQKPLHFQYKSGQWVRISCPALNSKAYHPFTLSSAPYESVLSVHIRAVGPWTKNLRNKLDPTRNEFRTLPRIHVDGPYGESHQNWDKYDISIMVAGGIGVTPFASILKDIVHKCNEKYNVGCKKIYFIWVTRSQKHFEWMVDILREVEKADTKGVISAHIFITQFYEKFDLRTILLYICERHFQKVSNKSLFTGLTAVTHFGRPNFGQFFMSIQKIHTEVDIIGVFSCGTPTMTRAVNSACQDLNGRNDTKAVFQHHYKSF